LGPPMYPPGVGVGPPPGGGGGRTWRGGEMLSAQQKNWDVRHGAMGLCTTLASTFRRPTGKEGGGVQTSERAGGVALVRWVAGKSQLGAGLEQGGGQGELRLLGTKGLTSPTCQR
jgi:hypothetical protein